MISMFWIGSNTMGIIILCFMYYSIDRLKTRDFQDQKIFNFLQIAGILYIVTDTAGSLVIGARFPAAAALNYFINTLHFIVNPLPSFFWLLYCDSKVYNGKRLGKRLKIYAIPIIVNTVFVSLTPLTGWTFNVDPGNIYHRGAYMWVTWLVSYCYLFGSYPLLTIDMKNKPRLPLAGYNIFYYLFQIPPIVMGAAI